MTDHYLLQRSLLQRSLITLETCVSLCFDRYSHEQVMSQPDHFVNQMLNALRQELARSPVLPVRGDTREGLVDD